MPHVNALLIPTGQLRMVLRRVEDAIPKAHVAAEFRVSMPTVTTRVARYFKSGEAGLVDRSEVTPIGRTPPNLAEAREGSLDGSSE